MRKKKLLNLKEARQKVEAQANTLDLQRLAINALENNLKSMTGARDNCKTMHEFNAKLVEEKNADIKELESQMRYQSKTIADLQNLRAHDRRQLMSFQQETALQTVGRGLRKIGTGFANATRNLVARLQFKSAK